MTDFKKLAAEVEAYAEKRAMWIDRFFRSEYDPPPLPNGYAIIMEGAAKQMLGDRYEWRVEQEEGKFPRLVIVREITEGSR